MVAVTGFTELSVKQFVIECVTLPQPVPINPETRFGFSFVEESLALVTEESVMVMADLL